MLLYYWTCIKLRVTRVLILLEIFHPGTILHFKLNQLYNHFGNLLDNQCKISDFRRSLINSTWFVEMKICRFVLFRVPFCVNNSCHCQRSSLNSWYSLHCWYFLNIWHFLNSWYSLNSLHFWIHHTSWIVGTHFLSSA